MPRIVAVIQLWIGRSRSNHHVALLRQMVKLEPRLLMQLTVLVVRPRLQLYLLYLTIDQRGFLDPGIKYIHLFFFSINKESAMDKQKQKHTAEDVDALVVASASPFCFKS